MRKMFFVSFISFLIVFTLLILTFLPLFYQKASAASLDLRGINPQTSQIHQPRGRDVGDMIDTLYKFGLALGGLLAFGAIVYGGIQYTISAGNPSRRSDAKQWITQALVGLLLLAGAALLLQIINPNAFRAVGSSNQNIELPPVEEPVFSKPIRIFPRIP